MKLIDAIKHQGSPFDVPNCSRDELPEFFKSLGFKTGAEIGVYKGEFIEKFCKSGFKMYAIDNWIIKEIAGVKVPGQKDQARQDYLYEKTKKRLAPYDCRVLRKSSMDAVNDFGAESLDFVYIDAEHSFRGIAEDLYEWYLRVRKGGVIAGHDFAYSGTDPSAQASFNANSHVPQMVKTFVEAFNIPNFYVFGRSKPIVEEAKNDLYLSWMFFKQ